MSTRSGAARVVPGRPAGGRRGDCGMVTAEAAVVLPVLLVVLGMAVWALACVAAALRCTDAAHEAARFAARGEPPARVVAIARAAAPGGATVSVSRDGEQVVVLVQAQVRPFGGLLRGLPAVPVRASATALAEQTVGLLP